MTTLQWVELVILIILFSHLFRDPEKRGLNVYLPDCVESLYLYLRNIPLCVFVSVYSLWYGFKNIPFFWDMFVSADGSLSGFFCGLFSLAVVMFSAVAILTSVATLLYRLRYSKSFFFGSL